MGALGLLEHSSILRALVRPRKNALDARLAVHALGLDFAHPVGLAAGFDKNGRRPCALAALGFSHLEIGTVTAQAQDENPPPNLFRLPADHALINRLGFPNEGAETVTRRLAWRGCEVPVGISIGKSRAVPVEPIQDAVEDYLVSFRLARQALTKLRGFVVVNVSSPNTKDLRAMQGADVARTLLDEIARENTKNPRVPVLLKIAPDLSDVDLESLLEVVDSSGIDGIVATNTTISREGLATDAKLVESLGAGGLSGPPLRARSLEIVKRTRSLLGSKKTIIGVGGVSDGASALDMLRAGADLLQIYTGFIYGGPFTAMSIAREIGSEMDRLGAKSIAELTRR